MQIARPELFTSDVVDPEEVKKKERVEKYLRIFLEYKERLLKGEKVIHEWEEDGEQKEITLEECEECIKYFEEILAEMSEQARSRKDKWLTALKDKVEESKQELSETEREKVKRIARLESKISELEKAKATISQQTQTDLTMEQIKQWEVENNKTWYQKVIDRYSKK